MDQRVALVALPPQVRLTGWRKGNSNWSQWRTLDAVRRAQPAWRRSAGLTGAALIGGQKLVAAISLPDVLIVIASFWVLYPLIGTFWNCFKGSDSTPRKKKPLQNEKQMVVQDKLLRSFLVSPRYATVVNYNWKQNKQRRWATLENSNLLQLTGLSQVKQPIKVNKAWRINYHCKVIPPIHNNYGDLVHLLWIEGSI